MYDPEKRFSSKSTQMVNTDIALEYVLNNKLFELL